ncbi:MAG TPA: tautomerase family protein [Candidatus Thermoplasmatota archaeon]|nr:tautomerase family protein [Candidatus Thermoplasmatota archaeon]
MPTIRVTAIEGHSEQQVKEFMDRITDLTVEVLGAAREGVIIHFEEIPANRYMRGGMTIAERRAAAQKK